MSVSDKLVQIAENMPQVYNSGLIKGKAPYVKKFNESSLNGSIQYESELDNFPIKVTSSIDSRDNTSLFVTYFRKNLYNQKDYPLEPGYISHANGNYSSSQNYYCARFIRIPDLQGETFYLNCTVGGASPGMAFYDSAKNFISKVSQSVNYKTKAVVPSGAVYFSFSVATSVVTNEELVQISLTEPSEGEEAEPFVGGSSLIEVSTGFDDGIYDWNTGTYRLNNSNEVLYLKPCPVFAVKGINHLYTSLGTINISNSESLGEDTRNQIYTTTKYGENSLLDQITNYGARGDYSYGFTRWKVEYLRPNYQIKPNATRLTQMFALCTNLKRIESKYFDLSGASVATGTSTSGLYSVFSSCESLEEIEDIGLPAGGYYQTFSGCTSLETIHKISVNTSCQFSGAFNRCTKLKEIKEINGQFGQDGLNLSWSPLNKETLLRVVNALGTVSSNKTVTLRQSAVDSAFKTTEEIETWNTAVGSAEARGWTITLMDS